MVREFGWYPGIADRIYWRPHGLSDVSRLQRMFAGCEVVIHAAAAKIVHAHPDESDGLDYTNNLGTQNVVQAATAAGVSRVLVISSDKAVAPENDYGKSKASAESYAIGYNATSWSKGTRISCLRYGNVIGSTSSVAVKWREAVAVGQPLNISDPRMTRFWVTMPQAVDHVLNAVAMMRGGEIFAPHLPAASITTLAQAICGPDYAYDITGIRPGGEKLHEQLLSEDDVRRTVKWRGYYIVMPSKRTWDATPWPGAPIPEDTLYRSDVWANQLTPESMKALIDA